MLASVASHGLNGIAGFPVTVEADLSGGLPAYDTVGLPDAAVRESRERVRAAIKNAGFSFPTAHITVSLAPAGMRKEGAVYDLPIAVALLAASGQVPAHAADGLVMLGELALDGTVRAVSGVLPMALSAYGCGIRRIAIPAGNAAEVAYLQDLEVLPVRSLSEFVAHLRGTERILPCPVRTWDAHDVEYGADFSEIRGQQGAKRAAEIAVAGGHNLLLIGTPGSGKTMLARSIPSILPELTLEEALEITKIHSVTGATRETGAVMQRPFRAPHHGASAPALVGGGARALPGEISLAHLGVLFLDELPEFQRDVLESLRQPLEDGVVTVTRAAATATYPAEFMLVAAMNPCPCGNLGSRTQQCRCTATQIQRYRARISGPLLDRIDLHVEMPEVGYTELSDRTPAEASAVIRARVNAARARQRERFREDGILCNAQMGARLVRKYCAPDAESESLLRTAYTQLNLSARAYQRILKVARTIADVEGCERIHRRHYAEAIQYRSLDMNVR